MAIIAIVSKILSTLPVLLMLLLLSWSDCWKLSLLGTVRRVAAAFACHVSNVVTVVATHCSVWASAAMAFAVAVSSVWWVSGVLLSIPVNVYVDRWNVIGLVVVLVVVLVDVLAAVVVLRAVLGLVSAWRSSSVRITLSVW